MFAVLVEGVASGLVFLAEVQSLEFTQCGMALSHFE